MPRKPKHIAEFGDFQTPPALASEVCALLTQQGLRPKSLLEPTCGIGQFLFAGLDALQGVQVAVGADINADYVAQARQSLRLRPESTRVRLLAANFFETNWHRVVAELPEAHAASFARRGSSIYRNRPPFAIFGVGPYSFAPWKVAISGFYKRFTFTVVGPIGGKPVMLDDTSYFLPCRAPQQARLLLAEMLASPLATRSFKPLFSGTPSAPLRLISCAGSTS